MWPDSCSQSRTSSRLAFCLVLISGIPDPHLDTRSTSSRSNQREYPAACVPTRPTASAGHRTSRLSVAVIQPPFSARTGGPESGVIIYTYNLYARLLASEFGRQATRVYSDRGSRQCYQRVELSPAAWYRHRCPETNRHLAAFSHHGYRGIPAEDPRF
jgi:hypothetical protein